MQEENKRLFDAILPLLGDTIDPAILKRWESSLNDTYTEEENGMITTSSISFSALIYIVKNILRRDGKASYDDLKIPEYSQLIKEEIRQLIAPIIEEELWEIGQNHIKKPRRKSRVNTKLFSNTDIEMLPSSAPMLSSMQAILKPDSWDETKGIFTKHFAPGTIQHFIADPHADLEKETIKILGPQAAMEIVNSFGVETAYLHLILAAHAVQHTESWKEPFVINGQEIIHLTGLDKRTDLNKAEKFRLVRKQVGLLRKMLIYISSWRQGKGKKIEFGLKESPVWDISVEMFGQRDIEGSIIEPTDMELHVRTGLWASKFLDRQGQRDGDAFFQFGYLARETLLFNPYKEAFSAKIALYLTLMSRQRWNDGYYVRTLIEYATTKDEFANAVSSDQKYKMLRTRIKARWDNTLLVLHERGWRIYFDEDTYPVDLRPAAFQEESDVSSPLSGDKKKKGRQIDRLLEAKIKIIPPSTIVELLESGLEQPKNQIQKKKERGKKKAVEEISVSGADVRKGREKKKLSGRKFASMIGKSQSWVVKVEKGDIIVSESDAKVIKELLEI